MKKRIFALLLACLLCAALAACEKRQEEPEFPEKPPSGTENSGTSAEPVDGKEIAGSSLSWEIYADGTLYIKGTGDMPEFESSSIENSDLPWNPYRRGNIDTTLTIKKIVVEEGVTSISARAFEECVDLAQVTLPTTLAAVPYCAFTNCRKLTTVSGGIGLTVIEENAFQGCTALRTISLSTPIRTVELGAFSGCGDLAIYFTGNEDEWEETKAVLTVAGSNEAFATAMAESVRCFAR